MTIWVADDGAAVVVVSGKMFPPWRAVVYFFSFVPFFLLFPPLLILLVSVDIETRKRQNAECCKLNDKETEEEDEINRGRR